MTATGNDDSLEFPELAESEKATGASVRNLETTLSSTYVRSVISGAEQASEGSCIVAIGESRGAATEVGVAIYDCSTSECKVGQVQRKLKWRKGVRGTGSCLVFGHNHILTHIALACFTFASESNCPGKLVCLQYSMALCLGVVLYWIP
jgi:hypothetical protein